LVACRAADLSFAFEAMIVLNGSVPDRSSQGFPQKLPERVTLLRAGATPGRTT
jgi:hypothetical protein